MNPCNAIARRDAIENAIIARIDARARAYAAERQRLHQSYVAAVLRGDQVEADRLTTEFWRWREGR